LKYLTANNVIIWYHVMLCNIIYSDIRVY